MNTKTYNLQLAHTSLNSNSRINTINNNFDTIDAYYGRINSQINGIQNTLGNLNYLSISDTEDSIVLFTPNTYELFRQDKPQLNFKVTQNTLKVIKFIVNNFWKQGNEGLFLYSDWFLAGKINNEQEFEITTIYSTDNISTSEIKLEEQQDMVAPLWKQYSNINDYTGFYIYNYLTDKITVLEDENGIVPKTPYSKKWTSGEIICKTSEIEENQRKSIFLYFPQALGGYYKPEPYQSDQEQENIIFKKVLPAEAPDSVKIYWPPSYMVTGHLELKIINLSTSNAERTIPLNIKVNDNYNISNDFILPPPIVVEFYLVEKNNTNTEISYEKILVDYNFILKKQTITTDTGTNVEGPLTWYIQFRDDNTEIFYMRYYYLEEFKWIDSHCFPYLIENKN